MDFSSFTNFDDLSQDKPTILRPRVAPNTRIRVSLFNQSQEDLYESPNQFKNKSERFIRPNTVAVNSFPSPRYRNYTIKTFFFGFEGHKVSLKSLRDYKSNKSELSPLFNPSLFDKKSSRTKKNNFRRLRWESFHAKPQVTEGVQGIQTLNDKLVTRIHKKNKNFKHELIPQTKACIGLRCKQSLGELRISGVMKDFALKLSY
jgi:hypothetical protein